MSHVGGIFTALIEAARNNDPKGEEMLRQIGQNIYAKNVGRFPTVEDAVDAARQTLDYYRRAFPPDVAEKVRTFYRLDAA